MFALSLLGQAAAQTFASLPKAATVIAGQADFANATGKDLVIKQTTDKLVLNWTSFGIGDGHSVSFEQPGAQSVALNRVTGTNLSKIHGSLTSNGRIFLVNPNGALFGAGASVNVGSLVVSTLDINDNDFLRGKFQFVGTGAGDIRNEARIQASSSGEAAYVALIAKKVTNTGTLHAGTGGTVALGAGSDVTLDFGGPVRLQVNGGVANALITNTGGAYAGGGQVILSARGESQVKAAVINQSGILNAERVGQGAGGRILLMANNGAINAGGTLEASGTTQGGTIEMDAGEGRLTASAASLSATGATGLNGAIHLGAKNLQVGGSGVDETVTAAQVGQWLGQGHQVALRAGNDLTLASDITSSTGSGLLALAAGRSLLLNASITAGTSDLVLTANDQSQALQQWRDAGDGHLQMAAGTSLETRGKIAFKMDGDAASHAGSIQLATVRASDLGVESARFSPTVTADGKAYDGTTGATGRNVMVDGLQLVGSNLVLGADLVFADKNAGTGKRVTGTLTLGGFDTAAPARTTVLTRAGTALDVTTQADIARRKLSLSQLVAQDKTYDGTTAASVQAGADDRLTGDDLRLSLDAAFADKNAGGGKTVSVSQVTLGGADAGNYEVSITGLTTSAAIHKRQLNLSGLTAQDKIYDGNRDATLSFVQNNGLAGDDVRVSAIGSFDTKNAGNGKVVSVSATLAGADAGNYDVDTSGLVAQASVIRRQLTLGGITAKEKTYDATTRAEVAVGSDDRIAGDDLRVSAIGSFDNKHAGANKVVGITGVSLAGADSGNYQVDISGLTTTANILTRLLTLRDLSALDRIYDGTRQATVNVGGNDRLAGDDVRVSATGSFDNKHAGTSKQVAITGVKLDGLDAANYEVNYAGLSTSANVSQRVLTLSALRALDKTYDGGRGAEVAFGRNDRIQGDDVTVTATGSFDNKNAGTRKRVTVTGVSLAGADAGNYLVDANGATTTTTASIDRRVLTLSELKALDKVYDRTTWADVAAGGDDRVAGDQLKVALAGDFDSRHVGRDKTVTVRDVQLTGADAANYVVSDAPLTTQAAVTPRTLQVSIQAADKVYDGRTDASIRFADDRLGEDLLQLTGGNSHFADANAGKGKVVTAAGWELTGEDAGNYVLNAPTWQTQAAITPRTLVASAPSSIAFDKYLRPGSIPFGTDALMGDQVRVVAGKVVWGSASGLQRAVTLSELRIEGQQAGNYVLDTSFLTTAATVSAPLPLPGGSGWALCGVAARGGCAMGSMEVASLSPFSWQGAVRPVHSTFTSSLRVHGLGLHVPLERLELDGE